MATATNVGGSLNLQAQFTETITSGVISTLQLPANINQNITYTNGTAAGMVDYIYAKTLSLAGSATTLDLQSLTDLNGGAIVFTRIRELLIVNLAVTAAYTVTVGAASATQWTTGPLGTTTATSILQPSVGQTAPATNGSMMRYSDPWSVGASTGAYVDASHKSLKLDPGANTISVYVLLVGCSAVS